jgi:hypothetical protein
VSVLFREAQFLPFFLFSYKHFFPNAPTSNQHHSVIVNLRMDFWQKTRKFICTFVTTPHSPFISASVNAFGSMGTTFLTVWNCIQHLVSHFLRAHPYIKFSSSFLPFVGAPKPLPTSEKKSRKICCRTFFRIFKLIHPGLKK